MTLVKAGTLTVCSDVPYARFEAFDKTSASGFKGFDVGHHHRRSPTARLKLS